MASPRKTFYFLVAWILCSTVHLCLCCMEGEGNFGWKCNTTTGCFCKEGQRCQRTLGNCPEHCVDNPWGVGCQDESTNLAYRKPVTHTRIFSYDGHSYPGSLSVDGDNSTDTLKCYQSTFTIVPTWSVYLEGLYVVRKVAIIKPKYTCLYRESHLCVNNDTTPGPRLDCRDISDPKTVRPNTVCHTATYEYNIDPPILTSHVTIWKESSNVLQLCEVIVRGYAYPYNIAYGKTASQSSVVDGGNASRAIDGVVNTTWEGGSCTQTAEEPYPWWEVDLGLQYVVYSITIYTSAGAADGQLRNVRIRSHNGTVDQYSDVCIPLFNALPSGVGTELTCSTPFVGQVVNIQLMVPQGNLSLCEVTVKGYKYPEYPYLSTESRVLVVSRTHTSVKLRWRIWSPLTGHGVGAVQHYVIKAWRYGSLVSDTVVGKYTNTGTVGGLSPGVEYNFTVIIRSGDGVDGLPSPIATAKTCEEPLTPPVPYVTSHLVTSNRSADIVLTTVGIENALHRCDGFARLTVRYEGEYGDSGTVEEPQVTESQLINITNLTTYSRYTIRLSIVSNINLEGPAATVIHTTPEGIPPKMEPPTIAIRHQAGFQISWTPPYPPGGILTGYQIMYGKRGDSWTMLQADSGETYKNIDDILFNTSYIFKIRASTAVGQGRYSDVVQTPIFDNMISTGQNGSSLTSACNKEKVIGDNSATVAGIVVAGIVVTTAIIVAVIIVIRNRRQPPPSDSQKRQSPDITDIGQPTSTTPPSTNTYCTLNHTYMNEEFQETEYSEINVAVDDGSKN